MIIPTQAFHVARAVYIARSLGIETIGISVDNATKLPDNLRLQVREFFAHQKAFLDIYIGALPHHLGEKIPLGGPSNAEE